MTDKLATILGETGEPWRMAELNVKGLEVVRDAAGYRVILFGSIRVCICAAYTRGDWQEGEPHRCADLPPFSSRRAAQRFATAIMTRGEEV